MEKRTIAATQSLRPKPLRKLTYAAQLTLDENQKFLLKATDTLRKGTVNDIDTHCQLRKFEEFQYHREHEVRNLEEEDALALAATRRGFRDTMLTKEKDKKSQTTQFMREMTERWKDTQRVKQDRVKRDLQYELTVEKLGELSFIQKRLQATKAERTGIDFFEKNLKKMGISSGDADSVQLSISYEAPDIFERRLEEIYHSKAPSNEEAQSFINQLKERTAEKRQARYEKARRRRRALASMNESTNTNTTSSPEASR